ncbi:MAG: HPr(Ser) kinase/phosphatase [Acidobacteria bacterium]|nr:HPr(Ser) kinase/phosphatase [Acidobacteriota bacterium]
MTASVEPVSVERLLKDARLASLELRVMAGEAGIDRLITNPRLQKPGLALAGFLDCVKPGRVQIIGASETAFLRTLGADLEAERVARLIAMEPPLVMIAKDLSTAVRAFATPCQRAGVPLVVSSATTSVLIERFAATLEFLLAPRAVMHGDLLDVFAIGVLLVGDSGSGKSECALELVHRGHRLVADDVVEVFRLRTAELIGQSPEQVRGLMEVRGLGLISIEQLFGVVSVRDSKPVDLVIKLVTDPTVPLERLGLAESTTTILDIQRPELTVPVAPGRNLALLVECAARKYLLTQRGVVDAAREYLLRHDRDLAGT